MPGLPRPINPAPRGHQGAAHTEPSPGAPHGSPTLTSLAKQASLASHCLRPPENSFHLPNLCFRSIFILTSKETYFLKSETIQKYVKLKTEYSLYGLGFPLSLHMYGVSSLRAFPMHFYTWNLFHFTLTL